MYQYHATILNVVDGDTFDARVEVGFYASMALRFRLAGYNAPESRGVERVKGIEATRDLRRRLPVGSAVVIRSHKTGSFGRWIADVETPHGDLVESLIQEGYGVPWDGKGRRPMFRAEDKYPLEKKG